ncbi:hypothetical protein [Devosia sp.]|uniref:hypothetical protein n=1 Tax=Devosia sp. TaxID=1871048 RepID=UPI003BAB22DC
MTSLARLLLASMLFGATFSAVPVAIAQCPERPACQGCGCKGGPGYRAPDGKCVGFKTLTRTCGDPPTTHCTFENAPGSGLNHDCALGLDNNTNTTLKGEH